MSCDSKLFSTPPLGEGGGDISYWHLVPTSVRSSLQLMKTSTASRAAPIRLLGSENWRRTLDEISQLTAELGGRCRLQHRTVQTASRIFSCRLCETGVRGDMLSVSIYISTSRDTNSFWPFTEPRGHVPKCSAHTNVDEVASQDLNCGLVLKLWYLTQWGWVSQTQPALQYGGLEQNTTDLRR